MTRSRLNEHRHCVLTKKKKKKSDRLQMERVLQKSLRQGERVHPNCLVLSFWLYTMF